MIESTSPRPSSVRRRRGLTVLAMTFVLTVSYGGSCSDLLGPPASQNWLVIDEENELGRITMTYVTVLKGGAISQGGGTYVQDVTGTCSFQVPLSGNWNGTIVRITSTGGACGVGYTLTMEGDANAKYGDGDSMDGTYHITYTGLWKGTYGGAWRATFSH